ncbi:F-box/LRR-repeat protein [Prunus yedoensis var. nudiflora]|uniref:F-box/LRR-repeat protein n=1 Tax=Prunus yedoensis var. nudiflora TaxID=2094558 RepID=A0A314XG02_PRUYE|nr:F-box/LRR-repeat protein [Prunus yedoensis var. nudiflora]
MEEMEEASNQNPSATVTNRNLNDLPEELLLHILTCLPILESVQTSLISQKWRPLWSRVPSLNFLFELFPPYEPPLDTRQFFAEFIDRVLILRSNSPIHTFRLSFIYHGHYRSHVDSWVRSAITRLRTRELYLDFFIHKDFHNEETHNHRYDFPFSVLRNGCVAILGLTRCDLTLPAKMSTLRFYSIGSMFLNEVYLTDQAMRDLISGCPNLEALDLENCLAHHHMKICSTKLKRLALRYFYDSELKETILVDCPNLCSISFNCCAFDKFVLKNASSLVEFHVDILHKIDRSYRYWNKVVRLLGQAPNVKHLNVQNWWFKFLTSKDSFPKSFMIHNLNHLELRTGFTQYDLVGMAALLKLCPNLETMMLDFLFKIEEDETLSEEFSSKPVELSMPSLKQVTVTSYTGTEDEVNFMKMLSTQGVALEKIILVLGHVGAKSRLQMVLYRNASQSWKCYSPDLASTTLNYIDAELFKQGINWLIESCLVF